MNYKMYKNELDELSYQAQMANHNNLPFDKVTKKMPEQFGTGHVSTQSINDLLFTEQYFHFSKDLIITDIYSHSQENYCFLTISLEGEHTFKVNNRKKNYHFAKNFASLGISQEVENNKLNIKKDKVRQYSFMLSKETLLDYLIEFDDPKLISQIENTQEFELFKQLQLSPTHHHLIEKMVKNPYHGSLQKIYFETCANELMITLLKDLSTKKTYNVVLCEDDKIRLQKAKEILLLDIQDPPTIVELAKKVALNQDKLKKGFKILFENTILKTLTEERMKIAYKKLQNNDMSVSEISYKVGYLNVSSFIEVFKKYYGKTPGEMRKDRSFYWFE